MTKFLSDCVNKYRECSGFEGDFPKVPTPNLVEITREHKARNPNFEIKEGASPAARHGKARAQTALLTAQRNQPIRKTSKAAKSFFRK